MSENKNIENSSKDEEKVYEKPWFWLILWIIFLLIFFTWNMKIEWIWIFKFFEKIDAKDIWDSFNIFNSLIGAITIILIFRTYNLQQRAFQKQSEELKATKEIFQRQKEEMEEQKKIMKQQEKEMQEQNHQQYVKFLLEQKNEILKNLNFREQKWIEIFYKFRRNFNNTSNVELLIWFIWTEGSNENKNNLWLFESFYKKYHWVLQNYKKLCQYTEFEFKKSKNTENLAYLAITPEEQFCFDLMNWFDEYWKKSEK